MADRYILAHIQNLPLLARLTPEQLNQIAEAFDILSVNAGQLVFQQGTPAHGLYLLTQGHGVLYQTLPNGENQILAEVHENQFVGESALFQGGSERMSMGVREDSVVLLLTRQKFQAVVASNPAIATNLNSDYHIAPPSNQPAPAPVFKGQRQEEQLLLRQQRHIWAFWRSIVLPVAIGIAILVIGFVLAIPELLLIFVILSIIVTGGGIYYLYAEWANDYIVITDQRVIHTEQTILSFESRISEVPIASVQEVKVDIPSSDIFARLFNYGSIFIRTAGESGNMHLTAVPNPMHIQNVLLADKQQYHETAQQQDHEAILAALDQYIQPTEHEETVTTSKPQNSPKERPGFLSTRYYNTQNELVYRKHLTVWATNIFFPTMTLFAAVILVVIGLIGLPGGNPLLALETVFGLFLGLAGMAWWFLADWDWRNDMLVIGKTTLRIIHKRPLWLQDSTAQFLLNQVDNVDVRRDGLMNTLLNRGNVNISLVGDDEPKPFRYVSDPGEIQETIFTRRAAMLQQQKDSEVELQRQEIAKYIGAYHERMQEQQQPTIQPAQPQTYWQQQMPVNPPPQPPAQPPPQSPGGQRPPRIPRTRNE